MLILFFFFFPGLVQKVDQRLPVANEYLLLSGGAREGVLDLNPEELGDYAKGADFDLDFTLLVPALKLHDRNQVGAVGTGHVKRITLNVSTLFMTSCDVSYGMF